MAVRAWIGPAATATGAAAGAAAAQLGFGYGLGVINWLPSTDPAGDASWVASLTWATWIAATATVAGAVCAARMAGTGAQAPGTGAQAPGTDGATDGRAGTRSTATALQRITLALAAGIGALVTVALVAVPARLATRADTFSPQAIAAGYAVVGVLLGLLVAVWALSSPAVAGNLIGTACWLWLLATAVVIDAVVSGHSLAGAQLGSWWTTGFGFHGYLPAALISLGPALLIGILAARPGARRAGTRVGATISGAVGPLLAATAHLLAAPRLATTEAGQVWPHLITPAAVVAGLAGSALVAAYAQRAEQRARPVGTSLTGADPAGEPDRPDTGATDSARPDGGAEVPRPASPPRVPVQSTGEPGDGSVAPGGTEPGGTEPAADAAGSAKPPSTAAGRSRSARRAR